MMNIIEACDILGVKTDSSEEEVSKAFKKMALKYHPDKNPNSSDDKFKKIIEAHTFIKNNLKLKDRQNAYDQYNNFDQAIYDFIKQKIGHSEHFRKNKRNTDVRLGSLTISFKESITGVKKEVTVKNSAKCNSCDGLGHISVRSDDKCLKCSGKGKVKLNDKDLPCTRCKETGFAYNLEKCSKCDYGVFSEYKNVYVNIPAGIKTGSTLRVKEAGGFDSSITSLGDTARDGIYTIIVENDEDFYSDGINIYSTINISLLEALKGTKKEVETAYGSKNLIIKPGIKNAESIRVKGFGVNNKGYHIFKANVYYPKDTDSLIKYLESENNDVKGDK